MKKVLIAIIIASFLLVSCSKHIHKVGTGGSGTGELEARQWYALWGLVPLNTVETNEMAAGAKDYTIETKTGGLDIVMNIFTGYVTIYSRTVKVTK